MEIVISKDEFLKGLYFTQGIVERRTTMPILANTLLEAKDDYLEITATDSEIAVKGRYKAKIIQEGSITLLAKKLYEVIKELMDADIHLKKLENNWVEIISGESVFRLMGMSSEEYPSLPLYEEKSLFELDGKLLKDMIEKTIFAVSEDEDRHNLNGVLFEQVEEGEGGGLRMVSTDGYRLCKVDGRIEGVSILELGEGIILPSRGLNEVKKVIERYEGNLKISFKDNNAIFRIDSLVVIMRIIEGVFPDYNQVIPGEKGRKIIINRQNFINSLKRVSAISTGRFLSVKFNIIPDKIIISSNNPEIGQAKEDLEVKYQEEEIEMNFNARYILDIINTIDEEEIEFELFNQASATIIRPRIDKNYTCIVMPIRLSE